MKKLFKYCIKIPFAILSYFLCLIVTGDKEEASCYAKQSWKDISKPKLKEPFEDESIESNIY